MDRRIPTLAITTAMSDKDGSVFSRKMFLVVSTSRVTGFSEYRNRYLEGIRLSP